MAHLRKKRRNPYPNTTNANEPRSKVTEATVFYNLPDNPNAHALKVTLNFKVKFPELIEPRTRQECDAILVIVERFTKYTEFIPLSEIINTPDLAYIVIEAIMSDFGVRDKLFTSKFQRTL
jgi:hypothetical protein